MMRHEEKKDLVNRNILVCMHMCLCLHPHVQACASLCVKVQGHSVPGFLSSLSSHVCG